MRIFRERYPACGSKIHLEDVWFRPELYKDNASGKLSVNLKVSHQRAKINARFVLKNQEGSVVLENLLPCRENGIYTERRNSDR